MTSARPEAGIPASGGQAAALTVRGLTRRFGDQEVLGGVDLDVHAGERVAVTGPNGAGKTTLLRCVAGVLNPTSGEVRVLGHLAGSPEARAALGVSLAQERSFYLRLSGRDNLRFFARLRGGRAKDAAAGVGALEQELQLSTVLDRRVDRCSAGMVQQLALARALLGNPSVVVLDEPTRSLDEQAVERLWGALERRPDLAVLLVTHRREDVERCTRRISFTAV